MESNQWKAKWPEEEDSSLPSASTRAKKYLMIALLLVPLCILVIARLRTALLLQVTLSQMMK